MKRMIRSSITDRQKTSPKRYIYEICDHLGWNVPMFTDPAAGGYRLRYFEETEQEAADTVKQIEKACDELGIKLIRSMVKPGNRGPYKGYFAYTVIPAYSEV